MARLKQANGARVVCVSSRGHRIAPVDFDDPAFEHHTYDRWIAYGQSKTANILFALALDQRGRQHGVRAFSLHPGEILTPLARHLSRQELESFGAVGADGHPVIDPANDKKTDAQGAATTVWCTTSPQLDSMGGVYCEDCDIAPLLPPNSTERAGLGAWAASPVSAHRLWRLSESRTRIEFST